MSPRFPRFLTVAALLLSLALATSAVAQYSGQRVPLGILLTNWDCAPCAPANQALDAYIPGQGNDVALIRVHVWWPGPDDPIFLANESQASFLANNTPTGADYAPHLWLDNIVNLGSNGAGYANGFEARKLVPAPLEIDVDYAADSEQVTATVHILDAMPAGDYRLYVAITEDAVEAAGTNGEPIHNQAFRHLYPDVDGVTVANTTGDQTFTVDTPLVFRWVFENLRATVYVQEMDSGEVMNTGTMFLSEGGVTPVGDVPAVATRIEGAAPNPFNPQTVLRYSVAQAGPVSLRIHDLAGRLVRDLVRDDRAAGSHTATWNGRDDRGRSLPAGVYLARLVAGGEASTAKLVLAK